MAADTPARRLADELVELLLNADPFAGTALGLRKYDALVPDPSAEAEQRLAAAAADIARRADTITTAAAGTGAGGFGAAGTGAGGFGAAGTGAGGTRSSGAVDGSGSSGAVGGTELGAVGGTELGAVGGTELGAVSGTEPSAIGGTDSADAATLDAVRGWAERRRRTVEMALPEFSASAMPFLGPPMLFAELARSSLVDAQAATDYLERARGSAGWITGITERLREGAARGRFPVASLLGDAVAWADRALAEGAPSAVTAPDAPPGWDGASSWRDDVDRVAREEIAPALARWRDQLRELRPRARGDEAAGVVALPGGDEIYANAIAAHTTLPFTAEELHRIGLDAVSRLEERARELGARIGLPNLDAVRVATRTSTSVSDPDAALAAAKTAVRRAEERAAEIMPAPLPGPCAVSPMPPTVAESGMAPHYTRPRDDGSRPGTYWFNTLLPTAGTGWDLEAVAFHETVPGHHSQLARLQRLTDLPLLQQMSVTVHAEGWGLYAERLAGEFGLYSGVEDEIGSVYVEMHRAARLVVDTGLHAMGWSRQQARDYLLERVALSAGFLTHEIDRYIVWPGQALAYMVGQREILGLRERAQAALGPRFDLPAFNAAVLDNGNLPMPALARSVDRWIAAQS